MRIQDRFLFSRVPGISFKNSKAMTKQSFAKEADINNIMSRYEKTGLLVDPSTIRTREAIYGDFSSTADYFAAQSEIKAFETRFAMLPAKVRSRFENNAGNLVDFLQNTDNVEEAVTLGLMSRAEGDVIIAKVAEAKVVAEKSAEKPAEEPAPAAPAA